MELELAHCSSTVKPTWERCASARWQSSSGGDPDRVVGHDAVFIANPSLPIRRSPEGYVETNPDLVVEVVSKNNTSRTVQRRCRGCLPRRGAPCSGGRSCDADNRRPPAWRDPEVLGEDNLLTIEDVIPARAPACGTRSRSNRRSREPRWLRIMSSPSTSIPTSPQAIVGIRMAG